MLKHPSIALFLVLCPLLAQSPSNASHRTGTGKPDFSGVWQAMGSAYWDLEAHAAREGTLIDLGAVGAIPAGLSVVEGGTIPYKPEALAKRKENQANWLKADPEIKCYLPGIPRATYMPFPFQIVQTPTNILMTYEFAGASRIIYMGAPKFEAPTDTWMGFARGRWVGDTLEVEVTGFNDQTWFDRAGNYHSDALRVVERYTAMGHNALLYEATIEDPNTFTRPWKVSMPLYRRLEKNTQLLEFKCVEFVEDLMYGHLRKKPIRKGEPK